MKITKKLWPVHNHQPFLNLIRKDFLKFTTRKNNLEDIRSEIIVYFRAIKFQYGKDW